MNVLRRDETKLSQIEKLAVYPRRWEAEQVIVSEHQFGGNTRDFNNLGYYNELVRLGTKRIWRPNEPNYGQDPNFFLGEAMLLVG